MFHSWNVWNYIRGFIRAGTICFCPDFDSLIATQFELQSCLIEQVLRFDFTKNCDSILQPFSTSTTMPMQRQVPVGLHHPIKWCSNFLFCACDEQLPPPHLMCSCSSSLPSEVLTFILWITVSPVLPFNSQRFPRFHLGTQMQSEM